MAIEREIVEERRSRVNPALIVILVLAVVAGLFFLVVQPLFLGGEEETEAPPVAQPPAARPSPSPSPTQAPAETFEVFESKDPFRPLVTQGAPSGATPAPGASPTPGTGVGGAPAPSGGQRVVLLDVFEEAGQTKAQIKVGSTVYTVVPGQIFADNFKLVSVSGNCVTLLHGDDKFTLCEGEEVIK